MVAIGDILNDTFRVERLIGQGGTASVYEVSHVRVPRRFALKVITSQSLADPVFLQRFRQEAEILASLDHPHLVHVLDWNRSTEGNPYLIMELLSGEDLGHFLARVGALSPSIALPIFLQVADALRFAHQHGIVHRDLKPGNIFLCRNGPFPNFVKVLDFGIAKTEGRGGPMQTERSVIMGTPAYMSPEQARGASDLVDARTDQFALASILYEMLAGRPAFYRPGDDTIATLIRVLTEDVPPLSDEPLDRAIRRALQKDRTARYPSLAEFVEATGVTDQSSIMMVLSRTERISEAIITRSLQAVPPPAGTSSPNVPEKQSGPSAPSDSEAPVAEVYPLGRSRRLRNLRIWSALPMGLCMVGVLLAWRANPLKPDRSAPRAEVPSVPQLALNPAALPSVPAVLKESADADVAEVPSLPRVEKEEEKEGGPSGPEEAEPADMAPPAAPAASERTDSAPERPGRPLAPGAGPAHALRTAAPVRSAVQRSAALRPAANSRSAGVKAVDGAQDPTRHSFIKRCGEQLALSMPEQVRRLTLTISRCAPVCVGVLEPSASASIDREVPMTLQRCLKQFEGDVAPRPVKIHFY